MAPVVSGGEGGGVEGGGGVGGGGEMVLVDGRIGLMSSKVCRQHKLQEAAKNLAQKTSFGAKCSEGWGPDMRTDAPPRPKPPT